MLKQIFIFTLIAILTNSLESCRTSNNTSSAKAEFKPNGIPMNWGNVHPIADPQTVEAKLANAAARRLDNAARLKNLVVGFPEDAKIVDGIVAVPIKMLSNDDHGANHPFGDGQKNASVGWTGWSKNEDDPPLMMTLATVESNNTVSQILIVEPSIAMVKALTGSEPETITGEISNSGSGRITFVLMQDKSANVYRALITLSKGKNKLIPSVDYPSAISDGPTWLQEISDRFAWPRVKVRFMQTGNDSDKRYWPVLFRFPAQKREEAQASLPNKFRTFSGSRKEISEAPYTHQDGKIASDELKAWLDAQPQNNKLAEFYPSVGDSGVHHKFTDKTNHVTQTATGGVDTYVVKKPVGKNQILYTCFAPRNPASEAQWGVPSGAGWHSIGHELTGQPESNWTFAETVVNSLEPSGIFAGWGVRTPYPFSEEAPYEAKDVVTFRVLRSGEAYTTAKKHFHWYAIDATHKACTIIWKHLGCELKNDRELQCNVM